MKEYPILFNSQMVRAILEGRKTQTRRVVNLSRVLTPKMKRIGFEQCSDPAMFRRDLLVAGCPRLHIPVRHPNDKNTIWPYCGCETLHPKYSVGDRLWVKEGYGSFSRRSIPRGETWWGDEPDYWGGIPENRPQKIDERNRVRSFIWKADGETEPPTFHIPYWWSNAMFMPRIASRITLEVCDVRIQRIQDISEEDAIADGVESAMQHIDNVHPDNFMGKASLHRSESIWRYYFSVLWDSINAKRGFGWDVNNYVFAYTFKRITGKETT